jgi:acetyl-CoA carboxylase/biotin carboxylase 1
MEGYDFDVSVPLKALQVDSSKTSSTPWMELTKELVPLLDQFASTESLFIGQDESVALAALAKKHKSDLVAVVPTLLAHKQVAQRCKALVQILRDIHSWPDAFSGYSHDMLPSELKMALQRIIGLLVPPQDGSQYVAVPHVYSEVAWKAKQIIDASNVPPVQERIRYLTDSLVAALAAAKDGDLYDLRELARQPEIAVNVDLLLTIMTTDSRPEIRRAALEVYIRRVYSSHNIHSLNVHESHEQSGKHPKLSADWIYSHKDVAVQGNSPVHEMTGVMVVGAAAEKDGVKSVVEMATKYAGSIFPKHRSEVAAPPKNELLIAVVDPSYKASTEQDFAAQAKDALTIKSEWLREHGIRSASVFSPAALPVKKSVYCNFEIPSDGKQKIEEIPGSRNMRPTSPGILELHKLHSGYDLLKLSNVGPNTHVYLGTSKEGEGVGKRATKQQVLFLRSFSLHSDSATPGGASRLLEMALEELERATLDPRVSDTTPSRVFLNVLPTIGHSVHDTIQQYNALMQGLIARYATRLLKLRVDEIEIKVRVHDSTGVDSSAGKDVGVPVRLVASSSSGGWLSLEAYAEEVDPASGHSALFHHLTLDDDRSVDGTGASTTINGVGGMAVGPGVGVGRGVVRETANKLLNAKRLTARKVGSTYAPDFLALMEIALVNEWQTFKEGKLGNKLLSATSADAGFDAPPSMFQAQELVLGADGELHKERRLPGANKIGMLAWSVTMKTPAYPQGREVIVIANDVTIQSGSFGVDEDEFFFKASEYARTRGLPRVHIACNSGARIGLVESLKPKFRIAWKDESNPSLGFEYLYLTPEDYESLPGGTVNAHKQVTKGEKGAGETRYVLDAIIGQEHGIGVENLKGSGLIAGETSRAYDETFTLSYVTGRSVGIGAYLNRLGQRVIQQNTGPMILTGYGALNKLLGKDVYTSQDQLGGPQVMYSNGISHEVVNSDQEGAKAIVDWLSYVPATFSATLPPSVTSQNAETFIDPPDRPVGFLPTKTPYNPRHMLAGMVMPDGASGSENGGGGALAPSARGGNYVSGFFDKGSFKEYMGGWGKSVVTGRAKLGGINVGVIAVETRVVEQRIPADPGNPESREAVQPQAGQVWYPDSAFKTAQAIDDFNRGENLPLIIFANWRGFSGGTRDMYGEILKFGAKIVDGLRNYKHPVFVYIPPNGELRGGAWVVVDPSINPDMMEMYADTQARGGILEPPGICEVKFRDVEQRETMHRLDSVLIDLDSKLLLSKSGADLDTLKGQIKAREKLLAPLYSQVAHEFADLHDRAGRMLAKGCIREILDWRSARCLC